MKILKKETTYLWKNIQLNKSRLLIFFILLILGFMLFLINKFPYASVGVFLILIAYFLGVYTYQKYLTWKAGVISADLVINELKNLPDSYALVSDVVIPPNRGDTDHIIIGHNGIFVIEAKHYSGEIKCKRDEWSRYKNIKGKKSKLWVGSPSNQVKRNAKVLKDFLLKHKGEIFFNNKKIPHIWVESILIFTNKKANLLIEEPTVNVLNVEELCDFIKNYDLGGHFFSDEEIYRIGKVILKYST